MFALVLLLCTSAIATTLVNRFQYLNAEAPPKRVWIFGVSHSQSQGQGAFSNAGARISNADYLSRELSYQHLLDEVSDPLERELAAAAFDVYGRKTNETAGQVINDVDVKQKADAYVLGRGLSEKSSFFVIFPVVTLETSFRSRFVPSSSLTSLANQLRQEGQLTRAGEILRKSESALRDRLDENGYDAGYPSKLTSLSNIYLNYRYQALRVSKWKLASDSFVIVPAGKKFGDDQFVPIRLNEEQLGVKQALTGAYEPRPEFALLSSLYYHKRFAFQRSQRIPNNNVSPLSADVDPDTRIKYGDAVGASAQISIKPREAYSLYVGQTFERKFRDEYRGNKFAQERYAYLETNTNQAHGAAVVGVTVNTIQAFLSQKFPIPMDLNLQYSQTNLGENVFRNRLIGLNVLVFYQ